MALLLDLLYLLLLIALSPWLIWRAIRTGRYRANGWAKLFGAEPLSNPGKLPTVWFHGVSVGEIHLLATVVAAFRKRFPGFRIVVSSTTDTGLNEAKKAFGDSCVLPYPFDFSWACGAALDSMRPELVVLAESELWPNFLMACKKRKVPVAVLNARISPRTFSRLNRVKSLAIRLLLKPVNAFAVQTQESLERLQILGVPRERLFLCGSVKYDGATGDRETPKARELRRLLKLDDAITLVAGSTHPPEETILLAAFEKLHARYPQLRLILVPRHPDRFEEVAKHCDASPLNFVRRSQLSDTLDELPPIILLDTIGELGAAWSLADFGYTGGSLDGIRGGQSMIEPAGYGVPTVFGPHVWNFRDAARLLVETGGAVMIREATDLEAAFERFIVEPELRRSMGEAARALVLRQQGATAKTLDVLARFLPPAVPRLSPASHNLANDYDSLRIAKP